MSDASIDQPPTKRKRTSKSASRKPRSKPVKRPHAAITPDETPVDGQPRSSSFLINLVDLPSFLSTATIEKFEERFARGCVDIEFEWRALVQHAHNPLFAHILARHDDVLSYDRMLLTAYELFPAVVGTRGALTRLGVLLTHLAESKPRIVASEMAFVLSYLVAIDVEDGRVDQFVGLLADGLKRLHPAGSAWIDELSAIGDEFVSQHIPPATRRYLRIMSKRQRANLLANGGAVDDMLTFNEEDDIRRVLRVAKAFRNVECERTKRQPTLVVLAQ